MIDARIQGGVFNPVEAIALDLALGVVGVTVAVSDTALMLAVKSSKTPRKVKMFPLTVELFSGE